MGGSPNIAPSYCCQHHLHRAICHTRVETKGLDRFTFEEAMEHTYALERLLRDHGISIRQGSALEAAVLSVMRIVEMRTGRIKPDWSTDLRVEVARLIGLAEISTQILRVREHADFRQLVPHFHLLNEGQAIQVLPSQVTDQPTNKLFELLVGCWAMIAGGTGVELDDPRGGSEGKNPDVLFTLDNMRWACACKTLHADNPKTAFESLVSGVSQIERSPASRGVVILGAKNFLRFERYWPLLNEAAWKRGAEPVYGCFSNIEEPCEALAADLSYMGSAIDHSGRLDAEAYSNAFSNSKIVPAVVLWGHIPVGVLGPEGTPAFSSIKRLVAVILKPPLNRDDQALLAALNNAAWGVPDAAHRAPAGVPAPPPGTP